MSNRNIGLIYIVLSLAGLTAMPYFYEEGGFTAIISCVFLFAMIGLLLDGLLIFYGKKLPSGTSLDH